MHIQIRGISAQNRPLTRRTRVWAAAIDASVAALATGAWIFLRDSAPEFGARELTAFAVSAAALALALRRISGTTPGLWAVGARGGEQGAFEYDRQPGSVLARAIFLTLAPALAGAGLFYARLQSDPRRAVFEPETLAATLPDLSGGDWSIQPFYYTTGAWPRRFRGKPFVYTVPYEKGPPRVFIGRILAHWSPGEIVFTAEGPKTPVQIEDPEALSACLSAPPLAQTRECVLLRRALLDRHVAEMRALVPEGVDWIASRFEVRIPGVEAKDWTRGLYLELRPPNRGPGSPDPRAHSRFIVFTSKGQQQSFQLSFPVNPDGIQAWADFRRAMSTQRVTDSLAPGRAWTEQKLGEWTPPASPPGGLLLPHLERFAELQSALVTRLSVDPARVDWYFHLAKSAHVLSQYLARTPARDLKLEETSALQRLLLGIPQAMLGFARDLAGENPAAQSKATQIEQFAIESKKLTK